MKRNKRLLPGLAVSNIRKNSSTYLPYLGISIFAMFTYFVFDLILNNDVIYTLPKGVYAVLLIDVGFYLLGFIMVPFLYYTNSFLIKRRKREMGLYSILGMEKKHIGVMMFWESLMLYVIVVLSALVLGLLFARLLFLVLLNMTKMPVDVDFVISLKAVTDMLLFYGLVTVINLIVNLIQVGKSNPVELMSEERSGERQPRLLFLWALLGVITLGLGYYLAMAARFDSNIFNNFFIAVLSVVAGTYFLFTSGSIVFLRMMKRKKNLYYRPDHFITVSGMLYRMKKNAAGLSNICIFSTMSIITVICSVAVYVGMDSIVKSTYEKEFEIVFLGQDAVDREMLKDSIYALAGEEGVEIANYLGYAHVRTSAYVEEGNFHNPQDYEGRLAYQDVYATFFTTLEEFNLMEGKEKELENGQILVYSSGADAGWETVSFGGGSFTVKEELDECSFSAKMDGNYVDPQYLIVARDEAELGGMARSLGTDPDEAWIYKCGFNVTGDETLVNSFSGRLPLLAAGFTGFAGCSDYRAHMEELESSYGGLLFVGIFYGLIFLICLVVTMYYKQITEGFEDQKNFDIMQKIGMSDGEIRRTIKKQIRMVFLLPLAGALVHTAVGMRMIFMLMGAIRFFERGLLIGCAAGVSLVFALVYSLCYKRTSQAYYRIVRQM